MREALFYVCKGSNLKLHRLCQKNVEDLKKKYQDNEALKIVGKRPIFISQFACKKGTAKIRSVYQTKAVTLSLTDLNFILGLY